MSLPYLNTRQNQLRLTGRTETLYWPRLHLSEIDTNAIIGRWYGLCVGVGIVVVVVDAFRNTVLSPVPALFADLLLWGYRAKFRSVRSPSIRFLVAPVTCLWFFAVLLPAIASVHSMGLWAFVLVILAGWRILHVTHQVREHYLDYAFENPRISVATRNKWKGSRQGGFRNEVEPARSLSEAELKSFRRARLSLENQVGFVCWVVAAFVCAGALAWVAVQHSATLAPEVARVLLLLMGMAVIALPGAAGVGLLLSEGRPLRDLKLLCKALAVWCHSPPAVDEALLAPWSARSRFGRADDRTSYLHWNLLFIALLILPVAVFYPWYSTDGLHVFHDPWLEKYAISGSKWFAHLKHAFGNADVPVLLRMGLLVQIFCAAPLMVIGSWILGLLPTLRAAETLLDGRNALEQEVQIVTDMRTTRSRA